MQLTSEIHALPISRKHILHYRRKQRVTNVSLLFQIRVINGQNECLKVIMNLFMAGEQPQLSQAVDRWLGYLRWTF